MSTKPLFKVWIYSLVNWSLYIRASSEESARRYGRQFGCVTEAVRVTPDIPTITKETE